MNILFKTVTGSHLYGTNTPESDIDYAGVFIAEPEHYFGLQDIKEVDLGTVSKLENGKNSKDAIDYKLYELKNFVKLALQNNPNILELLFTNKVEEVSDLGNKLLNIATLFPHQGCIKTYIGYANAQKHKMSIRTENYDELVNFIDKFDGKSGLLIDYRDQLKEQGEFFVVSDICINKASTINNALGQVRKRYNMFSNRKELISKHGFDTKFGSHLIRLLHEGKELLLTGEIKFPLQYNKTILDIKQGRWEYGRLIEYADELEVSLNRIISDNITKLRPKPNYEAINSWLIRVTYDYFNKSSEYYKKVLQMP